MVSKKPDEESRKSLRQFFGINPRNNNSSPITSNSFNTLVKIYSLLPDQTKNPFAPRRPNPSIHESGEHRLVGLEGDTHNGMTPGVDDAIVQGEISKQNALGVSRNHSTQKLQRKESRPKSCEGLRYTREQLLHLGKTAFVPEHVKKAVREIGAKIHEKHQVSAAFAIADSTILKNRKRGPSSETRKEKRKDKRRKTRAEQNKKDGVRRLKLQPIVKPKVAQPCRHYLQGRCHEGEKCKFSHDVVPLTKSKPCCHHARQACMKGKDCPFDHQLSKYPCDNYLDTGFCNRGESCMFSHKIPAKEGSEPSAMSLRKVANSTSKPSASIPFTSEKTTSKNPKEKSATLTAPLAKRPIGVSFFSFETSQLDDAVKQNDLASVAQQETIQPVKKAIGLGFVSSGTSQWDDNVPQRDPGSVTQRGKDHTLIERTLLDNSKPSLSPHRDNSSRMPSMNSSVKNHLEETSVRNDDAVSTPNPNQNIVSSKIFKVTPTQSSGRSLNLSEMLKSVPTPAKAKGDSVSSSDGPSFDVSGGKSVNESSTKGITDSTLDKSKEILPQSSSGHFSTKVDLPMKKPPNNAQRALESALAFAAKYGSGIKSSSISATKENNLNEGLSSGGSRQSQPLQASKILQFLNSQGDKEK